MEAETQSSILNAVCFWGLQLRSNQFFPGTIALRVTRVPSSGKERVLHAGYKPCARHLANLTFAGCVHAVGSCSLFSPFHYLDGVPSE